MLAALEDLVEVNNLEVALMRATNASQGAIDEETAGEGMLEPCLQTNLPQRSIHNAP